MKQTISKKQAEAIYREYADYIYRGAFFFTHSKELADDITQEVFIQVIRKYHTYDESKPIKPWLYKIMVNKVRDIVSKQRCISNIEEVAQVIDLMSVEESLLKAEESKELWKRMDKLTLKTKEVVYMHYYLELKLEEVADILEIPLGTCKSRLNAGLNTLRKHIQKQQMLAKREA